MLLCRLYTLHQCTLQRPVYCIVVYAVEYLERFVMSIQERAGQVLSLLPLSSHRKPQSFWETNEAFGEQRNISCVCFPHVHSISISVLFLHNRQGK